MVAHLTIGSPAIVLLVWFRLCRLRNYFSMLPMMPGGAEIKKKLTLATLLKPDDFEYRWSAD